MSFKSLLLGLTMLIQSSAFGFPGIENFVGSYKYISGPVDTLACGNFEIQLNSDKNGLDVFYTSTGSKDLSYEFPFVNMGTQPWEYDWGDGIAKGDQTITFDGMSIYKRVVIKKFGIPIGRIETAMDFIDDFINNFFRDRTNQI